MRIVQGEVLKTGERQLVPADRFHGVALGLGGLSAEPTLIVAFDDPLRDQIAYDRGRLRHRQRGHTSAGPPQPSVAMQRPGDFLVTTRIRPAESAELGRAALYDLAVNLDGDETIASELTIGTDHNLSYRDPSGNVGRVRDLSGLTFRDTFIAEQHLRIEPDLDGMFVTNLHESYQTMIMARPIGV